jgi:repressor of nif and glnA expression
VGTISRNKGWKVTPDELFMDKKPTPCYRIVSVGKGPMQVEKTDATVTIANPALTSAQALDANGMPMAEMVEVKQTDGQYRVTLPPDTLYVVVSR